MSQAGCDRDKAIQALKEAGGTPAEAIMKLIAG
jgi:NACalpha-BTF3-like transcription factor